MAFGVILLLCASFAHAQTGIRWDLGAPGSAGAVTAGTQGGLPSLRAQPGVTLAWCNHPANAVPCTNYATTYTSLSLSSSCPNNSQIVLQGANSCVATGDNFGNLGVYTASNTTCTVTCYDYTLTVNGVSYGPFVWTMGASGNGSGSLPTATAAGQYPNSTAAGTTYTAQSKGWIDVRDQGVDCTGLSDSTTAMQNMINNAPDYSSFFFPEACKVRLTGTPAITLDQRIGLQFIFAGRNGNGCSASGTGTPAMLFYAQSYASGNKVLYINRSQSLEFRNMTIWTNGGADSAIVLDQVGATPPITTRDDFYNLCIYNNGTRNSSFNGVSISPVSPSNVENIHFYHPDVTCSSQSPTSGTSNGAAILSSASFNTKNNIVDDLRATNCSVDVYPGQSSDFTMQFGLDSTAYTTFNTNGFNTMLYGFRSENATHAVNIGQPIGPLNIIHNDFAASLGTIVDGPIGCGQVNLIGNDQDSSSVTSVDCHGAGGTVIALGNRKFNMSPTNAGNAFVIGNTNMAGALTITDTNFFSMPVRFTPAGLSGPFGTTGPSAGLMFDTLKNATYDHFVLQAVPQNADSGVGLNINYLGSAAGYLGLGAKAVGLSVGPNATTAMSGPTISPRGVLGVTNWTYLVQAVTITGHSDCSTVANLTNGNAVLTGSNFNVVAFDPYAGAVFYNIYRTVAGGTPNTTGLIGTAIGYTNIGQNTGNAQQLTFSDTGLAGDGSTCTTGNTSGDAQLGRHLTQAATNFAGSCAMAASTTCTFSISAAYASAPIGVCSIDAASAVPATANSCKVSVSGTTVTITAGANNSLTWDAILVGNPN